MKAVKKTVPEKRRFPAGELFAAVLLLAATLFGCFFLFSKGENKKQTAQTAMLTQTPGLRVLSENPAPVVNGEARFSVETEEGYRFADLGGGILDGTVLTFRAAVGNSYTVTLAHPVTLSLADSERGELYFVREDVPSGDSVSGDSVSGDGVSGGTAEALPDRTLVRYTNETVTLRGRSAEPEHYSFCGVTADGVLYPAGDDGAVRAEFPCDSRIEPVFLGREVAVRISVGLRGSVTEGDGGERESAVYRYGESLPLRAEFDGRVCRFLGWSRKGYLRDGGELVSKELAYELELLGDSELYANFEAIRQYPLRFSDDSGDSPLSETMYGEGDYVSLPVDDGSFRREGYRCVGFTESKVTVPENLSAKWLLALEAREDFHSFGSMLAMPGRALTLSPVLIPETNPALLRFSESGGSAVVLGFSDAGKTARTDLLVLPERAPDGKTVTAIAENAFEGCGELIKADIPAGVKTIGAGAFRGCVSLRSLSLPETLRTLSGDAFGGCAALSRLCIHPTLEKVFDIDYDSALADKYMRLLTTEGEEKRLLLVGGSGCAYGINSGMLEEAFKGYTVVNLGTAVNYGIRPLLSILEARCKKGDVVLFSPEYREEMYGEPSTAMTSWQFLESNYDILRDIDLRKNGNLLSTYVSYLQSKRRFLSSGTKKYNSIVYSRASFDLRGDLIAHRQTGLKPFESHLPDPGILHEKGLSCLREGLTRLREKGVRCLYSFPLLADPGGLSKAEIRQAEESFLHALLPGVGAEEGNLTVISEMENSIAPVSDFYDSMYHATLSGAKRRTERLIRDLTPYLSDE